MNYDAKTIKVILKEKEVQLTNESSRYRSAATKNSIEKKILEVKEAIRRLEGKCYGFCEKCYIAIPWRELCAFPERRFCDQCHSQSMSA